jgi:hypothetical protein
MSESILGVVGVCIIFPLLGFVIWMLVVGYLYVDKVEAHLPSCRFVDINRSAYSGLGLSGKVIRVGSIILLLLFSDLSVKRGMAEGDELTNFPRALKWKIMLPWMLGLIWFVFLCVFGYFVAL